MSATPDSQPLVHCLGCGYNIPDDLDTRCPECGQVWSVEAQAIQQRRQTINQELNSRLKVDALRWIVLLFVFAVGAEIVAMELSGYPFTAAFLGIGFGIVVSLGVGIGICRFGPQEQRRLNVYIWTKLLWYLHAPWILIGPCTLLGSFIAVAFLFTNPSVGASLINSVVLIEFVAWLALSVIATVRWGRNYAKLTEQLGMGHTKLVYQLHTYFALLIWLGSMLVGLAGGALGSVFMQILVGNQSMQF